MPDFSPFFAAYAHRLQQANLYWPRTPQVVENPTWTAAKFRAMIVRLSSFRDVDHSTPHLFLADAVRRAVPEAFVDFAFFPPPRDRALLREHTVPWLTGIFSHHSAEDFNVVLISNAYTLELFNLPALLLGSGIPPWARARAGRWPPFILGGSNAMASQALLDDDGGGFVDAIFFGEGEEQVENLIRKLSIRVGAATSCGDWSRQGVAAPTKKEWAQNIPGLWFTGRWPQQPVHKATVQNPGTAQLPVRVPILNSGEAGTARLQINYGCPAFCTFCFEGYDRKPYREVAAADLLAVARELKCISGAEALELFSFNFNTHGELLSLLPELNRLFDRVNMMSQRVDLLATAPELLPAELSAGKRSFTLGIEGISTRLRAALHKSLPTADIHAVLRRLLREEIRDLKLFFLLTGDETADDFAEFTDFCCELRELCRVRQRGLRVIFSFGLLIRMPFTPLRHDRLRLDESAWHPLIRAAQRTVTSAGFEFRLAMPWPEYAVTQMLTLAPAGLAPALLAFAQDGFCFDQSLPTDIERRLRTWMQEHGLWTQAWLDVKPSDYSFAFDFVHSNVTPKFLFKQFQASKRGEDGRFCLGGECLVCGACNTAAKRKWQTGHRLQKPADRDWLKKFAALMEAKAKLRPIYGRFWLAPELAGATTEWLNAFVLRELLAALPDQTQNLLSVRESLFTSGDNAARWPIFSGETIFALKAWDVEKLLAEVADHRYSNRAPVGGASSPAKPTHPSNHAGLEAPPTKISDNTPVEKIRWLGQEFPSLGKDNTPVFQALEIALRMPIEFFPDAENIFQRWLKARRIAFSLRRTDRGLSLQFDPKKKTFLTIAELERHEVETIINLIAGPVFDLTDFIAAFGDPNLARRAGVVIRRIELR